MEGIELLDFDNILTSGFEDLSGAEPAEEINNGTQTDPEQEESVGEEYQESGEGQGEGDPEEAAKVSSENTYSSIATALRDDGALPGLDEDVLKTIKDPQSFHSAIEKYVNDMLDEKTQRVAKALENGGNPEEVRQYEQVTAYLDSITTQDLSADTEDGKKIRQNLIYRDLLNRGFTEQRAAKEVNKSIAAGSDIEDATEALQSAKDFYKEKYQAYVSEQEKEAQNQLEKQRKGKEDLSKGLMNDETFLGSLKIQKDLRQKSFDNITKPVHKMKDGRMVTAIQKYESENPVDFLKNLSILFTLTDGFKNVDKLISQKVNQQVRKTTNNLERVLNSTARDFNGNIDFRSTGDGVFPDFSSLDI